MPAATKTPKPSDVHEKLLEAIGEVDRPGDVCTSGDRPLTMPGLKLKSLSP